MLDPALQSTFEAFLAAFRRGDAPAFAGCFTGDAEGHSTLAGEIRGPAAFGACLADLHGRHPGLEIEPLRTYGEGPEMAARVRLRAADREAEGIFAFRFDELGRITRLVALWEREGLLGTEPPPPDPRAADMVEAYFRTYNENDEEAHMVLASPELVYFGAVSRITAEGLETARGIFRSAHARMGLKRLEPMRLFERGDHLAVMVRIHGAGAGGPTEEGVWIFRIDAQRRFDRVSVLWNPGTFLTWNHK